MFKLYDLAFKLLIANAHWSIIQILPKQISPKTAKDYFSGTPFEDFNFTKPQSVINIKLNNDVSQEKGTTELMEGSTCKLKLSTKTKSIFNMLI